MTRVIKTDLPADALHARYLEQDGCHRDCFQTDVKGQVTLAQFVEAFYTAPLFRCERVILKIAARRPSTDAQARAVAEGSITRFAAWDMEDRIRTQLLMCDMHESTRSWFMVEPLEGGVSRLRFGSVVTPRKGSTKLPLLVRPLMGLHHLYSILLLKGAAKRLAKI